LEAIGKVTRTRETGDKISTETAYYLFSTPITAERGGEVVRSHWGVENRLHWRLDVTMNEDATRNRMDNGPHNLAVLRWCFWRSSKCRSQATRIAAHSRNSCERNTVSGIRQSSAVGSRFRCRALML
jgi:predicted transposase YbfD/YdcC